MAFVSIGFGIILATLGVFFYYPDQRSITALIPTFFGAGFVVLGLLAFQDSLRKHVMHLAAMLSLVGFIFPLVRVLAKLGPYFGGELEHHAAAAAQEQSLMSIICLVFTALCVNSFIEARRARRAQAEIPVA